MTKKQKNDPPAEEEKDPQVQSDEYKAGWQRALADYENLKRDMADQLTQSRNRIRADFAHDLLPVMDNFAQAVEHAPELPEHKAWLDGVLYIQKQFEDVMSSLGLEKIDAAGEIDPHLHETVGEGDEQKEVRTGWMIGDHVIRPAQVVIKKETNEKLN